MPVSAERHSGAGPKFDYKLRLFGGEWRPINLGADYRRRITTGDQMVAATHGSLSPRGKRSANAAPKGWEENLLSDGELRVRLFDEWVLASGTRSSTELSRRLSESPSLKKISFDLRELGAWDNVLINFLNKLETIAGKRGIAVDRWASPVASSG